MSTSRGGLSVDVTVQMEVPLPVLYRLLRDRNLFACEFRCLDSKSHQVGCWALKSCCLAEPEAELAVEQ
ncbi:hypothetical protein [Kineobactrum salinum]|uniref:Uncharacterized protein n=1 Tax=Kineobactrum salinum TaxID=2708301 RepID=A0A6C0TZM0_9GAMM|nr:hypothetical protein [Kineobactrum salinum]QIB64809.1 hypothetical protein G3T16_04815 [Kineobactrum salinum]